MLAEQPTQLCKPRRKMRMKVDVSKTGSNLPVHLLLAVFLTYETQLVLLLAVLVNFVLPMG